MDQEEILLLHAGSVNVSPPCRSKAVRKGQSTSHPGNGHRGGEVRVYMNLSSIGWMSAVPPFAAAAAAVGVTARREASERYDIP